MHWEPPVRKNAMQIQYEVSYRIPGSRKYTTNYTMDEKISVDGLQQCTNYTVSVRAMNGASKASHAAVAEGRTGVGGESN